MEAKYKIGELVKCEGMPAIVESIEVRKFIDGELLRYNLYFLPTANIKRTPKISGFIVEAAIQPWGENDNNNNN